jgi:hypothetical protein
VCVITQDPLFFEGTLRTNLDPFGEHSDADLRAALVRVGLGGGLGGGGSDGGGLGCGASDGGADALLAPVTARGANLSGGQAQLLALLLYGLIVGCRTGVGEGIVCHRASLCAVADRAKKAVFRSAAEGADCSVGAFFAPR